jgi:hypothetical protein
VPGSNAAMLGNFPFRGVDIFVRGWYCVRGGYRMRRKMVVLLFTSKERNRMMSRLFLLLPLLLPSRKDRFESACDSLSLLDQNVEDILL